MNDRLTIVQGPRWCDRAIAGDALVAFGPRSKDDLGSCGIARHGQARVRRLVNLSAWGKRLGRDGQGLPARGRYGQCYRSKLLCRRADCLTRRHEVPRPDGRGLQPAMTRQTWRLLSDEWLGRSVLVGY